MEKPIWLVGVSEKYYVYKNIPKMCSTKNYQKGLDAEMSVGTDFLPQAFSEILTMNFQ